ncbi:MAG: DinB family protein, partial [Dehalococcoidia bacterium]
MQSTLVHDRRAALRAEIEATADSFRRLVSTLPDDAWNCRAPGSSWTGKQLLHHVAWALEQLPKEVESAKRGKGMFNYPKLVADSGSYWLVKW